MVKFFKSGCEDGKVLTKSGCEDGKVLRTSGCEDGKVWSNLVVRIVKSG